MSSPRRRMLVVMRKELRDAARDRRAVYSVLFGSLFGPVLVGIMLNAIAGRQREVQDIRIPVVGIEHAPALVQWLHQQAGVTVTSGPADAEAAVRNREAEVVLVLPDDYQKRFLASRPIDIRVVTDGSRISSRPHLERVRGLLQRYAREVAALRLIGRGVSPAVVAPFEIEEVEVSSAQQRGAMVLNFIPLFIVLAAFTGGMQIASDATAGERERGSLEPLLTNPVPRGAIAAGKWLAAAGSAALSVVLTTVLCLMILQLLPLQDLGIRFRLSPAQTAGMLVAGLPLCLFAAAVQSCLATFARSFKEAQTYMGFLIMAPMLPGMLSTVYPITSRPWMYPVPMLGQHVLLADLLGGKTVGALPLVVAGVAAAGAAGGLVVMAAHLLRREHIIFGR